MTTQTLLIVAACLVCGLWLLHRLGRALSGVLEGLAAVAVVFVTVWLGVKAVYWLSRQVVRFWRTSLMALAVLVWWHWLGVLSLVVIAAVAVAGLGLWRLVDRDSFEPWAGRHVRAWWQRWMVYVPRTPRWFRACGLTVQDSDRVVSVTVNPLRRSAMAPRTRLRPDQLPKIMGVRSGPSWDEVHVKLIPGLVPEQFDEAARALAVARGVARCQVRELAPNVVSIDFQRRNLLAEVVPCADLAALVAIDGAAIDLRRVWSGRSEYGTDWYQPLAGGHTLTAGSTGAGKNSVMWAPLVSIAPAIRDGYVRVSGIDPKGMELAYGRRIFHRYAVTSADALALLDDLVEGMNARKAEHAGRVRTVPISRQHPLELVEFDEIGALIRYVGDRKLREAITERVALLNTQGRALGYTVRGYVQEPTKDTVPVRELFPRRICLRVAAKSHVAMVLGDHAYDRGAWANRIGESEPGVGYLFGEGVREPLRVRAGWVSDETIKALEAFVTGPASATNGQVLALPAPAAQPAGGVA